MFVEFIAQNIGPLYIVSQIFALLSFLFDIFAVQQRKKTNLLIIDTAAAFCSFLHYAFLGAWSGMVSKIITTIRNAIAAKKSKQKHDIKNAKIIPWIFVGLYIVIGFLAFESILSILPILASSIYTVVIYAGNVKKIRYAVVLTNAIWLIYNIFIFSIVGTITSIILIINGLTAIYRYRKKPSSRRVF